MRPAFVYCAADGDVVKVGSTFYPEARIAALNYRMGMRLELVCLWRVQGFPLARRAANEAEDRAHVVLGRTIKTLHSEFYRRPVREVAEAVNDVLHDRLSKWEACGYQPPAYQRTYQLRRKARGICARCLNPAIHGRRVCVACREQARAYQKHRKAVA